MMNRLFFIIVPLLLWEKTVTAQTQRDVFKKPVWSCASTSSVLPKKYKFNVFKRKGDKRFQFVLVQTKPKYQIIDDIAADMKPIEGSQEPSTTLPTKMFSFSFAIDLKTKSSEGTFSAKLILDNSYDNKNGVVFTDKAPLELYCKH